MAERTPRPDGRLPAVLRPYVEALGVDDAERVFLALGGSQLYLPANSPRDGLLFDLLGAEKVMALSTAFGSDGIGDYIKVPLARRWVADRMWERGVSDNEIARTIRCDVSTVRRWFNGYPRWSDGDDAQAA